MCLIHMASRIMVYYEVLSRTEGKENQDAKINAFPSGSASRLGAGR